MGSRAQSEKTIKNVNYHQALMDNLNCDVSINGSSHVSHIPIKMKDLDALSAFKIIKFNYKMKKHLLEIFYSFKANQANNQNNKMNVGNRSGGPKSKYFEEQKVDEKDDRIVFSKEIIETMLTDLGIDSIKREKLDDLLENVHDILNRFQTLSYTKGYKAATKK